MTTTDIKVLGLEEVSNNEAITANGGCPIFWEVAADFLMRSVSAFLFTYGLLNQLTSDEEVEECYGGELDAAICIG